MKFKAALLFLLLSPTSFVLALEEPEVITLNKIVKEINYLETLVVESKHNQNTDRREQFDYGQLLLDLQRIRDSIKDHLDRPWVDQREVRPVEEVTANNGTEH